MRHLDTFRGGVLTSVVAGLLSLAVIAATDLANHAWKLWVFLGASAVAAGILLEVRSGERSSLFGLGLALGALTTFGALLLVMTALGLDSGR